MAKNEKNENEQSAGQLLKEALIQKTGKITKIIEPPEKTPLRANPRISLERKTKYGIAGKSGKVPTSAGIVLNVSLGGALLYSSQAVKADTLIQVELGEPIFPVPRIIPAIVKHTVPAKEEMLLSLANRGLIDSKQKGYLIGVEFAYLKDELRATLLKFIKAEIKKEEERRAAEGKSKSTARDRELLAKPPVVPIWAYALGMLTAAVIIVYGILLGEDELTTAIHGMLALAVFWLMGRMSAWIWNHLEIWRPTEATIVATTDGATEDIDDVLADADSQLKMPDDNDSEQNQAEEQPPVQNEDDAFRPSLHVVQQQSVA